MRSPALTPGAATEGELEGDSSVARDKTQRLFFALWPDDTLRAAIRRSTHGAVRRSGGKPVVPDNYHVTLKFLGSMDGAARDAVCTAAGAIGSAPFELHLDRIGFWAGPRILWLGAAAVPAPLAALVRQLEAAAQACGIDPEIRPYRPHVTLARKARGPVAATVRPVRWAARAFVLAESETAPAGARYRVLRSWPLDPKL